jgi:hypothetical protein
MSAPPVAGSQRPAAAPSLLRPVQKRHVGGHIRGARRVDLGAGEPERGHHCPFRGCTSRSPGTLRTVPRLGVTRRCPCRWNLAQRRQARTCRDGSRQSRPGWGGRPARRSYNGRTQRGHGRQQERDGGRLGVTAAPAAAPASRSSRAYNGFAWRRGWLSPGALRVGRSWLSRLRRPRRAGPPRPGRMSCWPPSCTCPARSRASWPARAWWRHSMKGWRGG